jgi:hypothetical protein
VKKPAVVPPEPSEAAASAPSPQVSFGGLFGHNKTEDQ